MSFSGVDGARLLAEELIAASIEALAPFGPKAQPLRDLARYVVTRRTVRSCLTLTPSEEAHP